ncbi:MAG TPA: hypothetical protein VF824_13815 [Thermoanaerobaculia bacterium]
MPRTLFLLLLLLASLPALATDLTVGYISRLPEIDYVWESSNPAVEGWPAAGSQVTWRANVRSWLDRPVEVEYVWRIDGIAVARGRAAIAPNATTAIDLPRTWSFTRSRISIAIDTANEVAEQSETNNSLEVFSDALSVGFYVERSFYDHFRAHQAELGIGSTSFENFAQRLIALFNDEAALAVYPETPDGVLDRWRLQKIVVVPDGALPLTPPADSQVGQEPNVESAQPNVADRSVDLQWGFPASKASAYGDFRTVALDNPFYIPAVILHELGHARYLTDVYAFDVQHAPPGKVMEVPGVSKRAYIYLTPEQGLMNRNYSFIDRYSAIALNRIAHHRAIAGNYNDPQNVGSFLNDLPLENRLTIRDAAGNLMTDANVDIYQAAPFEADDWYAAHWDATPDVHLRTDANGQVLVGRSPFGATIVNYWRGSNVVAVVRVEKNGVVQFGYLESRLFNMASWRGETAFADHELIVGRQRCGNSGPLLTSPAWDATPAGPRVQLTWSPLPDATSYTIWTATPGLHPRRAGTTTSTSITVPMAGRTYWWVEASFANCPSQRSESSRLEVRAQPKTRAVRR